MSWICIVFESILFFTFVSISSEIHAKASGATAATTAAAAATCGGLGGDAEAASCGESAPSSFEEKAPDIESFGESEDAASLKDNAGQSIAATAAHHHEHHHSKGAGLTITCPSDDVEEEEEEEEDEEDGDNDEKMAAKFETEKFAPQLKLLYAFAKELEEQRGNF